jgi:hypothetical protein
MEGITQGPWGVFAPSQFDPLVVNSPTRDIAVLVTYDNRPDEREADARFIAAAPTLVRELCEEVDKLRALLGEACEIGERWVGNDGPCVDYRPDERRLSTIRTEAGL